MSKNLKINSTSKFAVHDLSSLQVDHKAVGNDAAHKRDLQRATKETAGRITTKGGAGLIGGHFEKNRAEAFIAERAAYFDKLYAENQERLAAKPETPITITLPNGDVKEGFAFKTSPMDIALSISKGLADSVCIAKVNYSSRLEEDAIIACDEDEESAAIMPPDAELMVDNKGELWDLSRPLVGSCTLSLLKFDDSEAKGVFWHSSAHILGAAVEAHFGSHLTIGPALQQGFYYDSYMGTNTIHEEDMKKLDAQASEFCKKKHPFQRLVLSREQALEMFKHNPFKVSLITNKIPAGAQTTVYKCGPLIDLCMGPHLPHTGRVKAFAATKFSATNWLGQVTNDPLQRVYGIAFPDKSMLKQYLEFQEQAKQRDHRLLGTKQELFFFHNLSAGSAFWLPHGARIYNKLLEFIRGEYWKRGYQEVITPNVFNINLWEQSGHALHYKDNMFCFDVEGQEFAMKPMNCPSHCLVFAHRLRSYRELPIRMADFGVLHRNELSGALTGLTRVRRFQQDDGHIFCRADQIKKEVLDALDFMRYVYTIFGMTYRLELSTRPAKAMGDIALWDFAEAQLSDVLNEFAGVGGWKVNPGDGAFYGPKIDIKVFDALERIHQCATVQLDFQLPIRFGLEYKAGVVAGDAAAAPAVEGAEKVGPIAVGEPGAEFQRPVMIHRAMLGSVERMAAVLTEHWGGKWPFWISPRQCLIIPVDPKYTDYAIEVQSQIHSAGFYVDVDESARTLNKKVREGQMSQYNFILVVGEKEMDAKSVNIRTRENEVKGTVSVAEFIDMCRELASSHA